MKPLSSKKLPRQSAAIEVCRSRLHLVVMDAGAGEEPARLRVRSVVWRREAKSLSGDLGRQELRTALTTLAAEEKLRNIPLSIALSRDFCVTRVVAGASNQVRQELKKVEQRAPLYLGLGAGRKAIAVAIS